MYSVKIGSGAPNPSSSSDQQAGSSSALSGAGAEAVEVALEFSFGNPRVEHITGLVHLYRTISGTGNESTNGSLPAERSERLCVLALPEDLAVAEFCQFLGAHLSQVREMRFVRREAGSTVYQPAMILLRFDGQDAADNFFQEYNSKPFSSLEPEVVCKVVYVKDVEVIRGGQMDPLPPPGQTELPSCPVCLERLDEHVSGVITTVCNHRFHNECLQQWADSSCPVCRYVQQSPNSSRCSTCGTRDNLWICLICGHVGCGRYCEAHAADHFRSSGHCYSLELETQRVWDYVGDGYVHRLIRSHVDGKIVEVPSPAPSGARESDHGDCCPDDGGKKANSGYDELEQAQIASKLDAIAQEYNHLLASQLDSQRQYFEGLVISSTREAEERAAAATAEAAEMNRKAGKAAMAAKEAASRVQAMTKKLQDASKVEEQLKEEKEFLRNLNDTLISNQKEWQKKVQALEERCISKDAKVKDLEEQLHDLMMYIEAQNTISRQAGGQELAGGTLLPVPVEEVRGKSRKGRGKAPVQR